MTLKVHKAQTGGKNAKLSALIRPKAYDFCIGYISFSFIYIFVLKYMSTCVNKIVNLNLNFAGVIIQELKKLSMFSLLKR